MGCCVSTNKTYQNSVPSPLSPNHHHFPRLTAKIRAGNAPATPPQEEETVKEVVLSEATMSKQPESPLSLEFSKPIDPRESFKLYPEKAEESNGVSVVLDFARIGAGECLSTTTANLMGEKREDGEEEKEVMSEGKIEERPVPAKVLTRRVHSGNAIRGKHNRTRAPAKRTSPSPEQRNNCVGPRRDNVGTDGIHRVPGERSAMRSGLPGRRAPVGAETLNLGKGGSSMCATSAAAGGRLQVVRSMEKSDERPADETNNGPPPAVCESFENPLVSLECFIFL
ncbi:hypothetical protein Nepgr_009059 [Nepenthes gracilis]|uniref:Uncharacterized protein n=1 Tax=Nepenthes gracilis TaxID=150966 RepID=A0AAD3SA95_NEPGR|nr:hypothetical protein Nepgr_009059 [Nepenthes gracilis]